MRYGNLQIAEKPVGWFHGEERLLRSRKQHANSDSNGRGSWPAYDVELLYLRQLKESTNSVLETKQIDQRISKIQDVIFLFTKKRCCNLLALAHYATLIELKIHSRSCNCDFSEEP
ncbi:hypothetical protein OESDEN_17270 [Oesophagostomum dentatum]|uniref:Uncharacterized protein n=1 Tax=Oesophagostomum dentatum TaxID=61180 RepID=A0A0B1SDN3_OESDE|nr:hypothetical protein OESDEN_17270 [Oesophagostomum dentatum]